MYNKYETDKSSFPYRNFFIRLIIIICIVLVVFWSVSALTKNKKKEAIKLSSGEVFQKNLNSMKKAALKYFNEDNIPNDAKKIKKVSLKKLQKEKLIGKVYDVNKEECSDKKSYVRLSKSENKYILKTNLTCGDDTDYTISQLIYSTECDKTFLCEKKDTVKKNEVKTKEEDNTNIVVSEDVNTITSSSSNTSVKKSTKITYTKKRIPITKTNTRGKIIVKDTTPKSNNSKVTKLSNWSSWSNWEKTSCSVKSTTCDSNDLLCLTEVKTYSNREKVSTYTKSYTGSRIVLQRTQYITESECPGYSYVIIDGVHYRTVSDDYNNINSIISNSTSVKGWNYMGRASYDKHMNDTVTTKYVFISADYSNCGDTCTSTPKYIYDKYVYRYTLESNYDSCSAGSRIFYTIPVYRLYANTMSVSREENIYDTVCYMSKRTRTVITN